MGRVRIALALLGVILLGPATASRGQVLDAVVDPALGPRPYFGPGGSIAANGFGYGAYGPRGRGYYPGLYLPPDGLGTGPSPYYSPIFTSLAVMPPADAPDGGRAGWAIRPSLPFTGRRNLRLPHRR